MKLGLLVFRYLASESRRYIARFKIAAYVRKKEGESESRSLPRCCPRLLSFPGI